jgi:single-strand DNA-binding protein
MAGLNKVMIIGNLGKDPEMKYTANGNSVTKFPVAVNRAYTTPSGERKEETEWFNVVAWSKLAETCSQFLQKGRRVYVEGRLQTRVYEDPPGHKNYWTDLVANTVLFLESSDRGQPGPYPGGDDEEIGLLEPESLPFE